MPTTAKSETVPDDKVVGTPVRDRVAALSFNKDGTVAGNDPVLIGDKDAALAVTKRQLREQAVSAADDEKQRQERQTDAPQDPEIAKAKAAHQKLEAEADKRAESLVNALHES